MCMVPTGICVVGVPKRIFESFEVEMGDAFEIQGKGAVLGKHVFSFL